MNFTEASYPRAMVFEDCQTVIFPLYGIRAACVATGFPRTFLSQCVVQDRKKKPDAQLDKTYSVYVCQTHIHWAGQHMSLLLFNSLTTSHAALCHCCYVEKSQKVKGQLHTLLPLSNIQPALSWSRTCPNRDWLLSSFFFFLLSTLSRCSLPASSLDHVKAPNKETDTPLL